jgi:hypothetical protein
VASESAAAWLACKHFRMVAIAYEDNIKQLDMSRPSESTQALNRYMIRHASNASNRVSLHMNAMDDGKGSLVCLQASYSSFRSCVCEAASIAVNRSANVGWL